MNGLIEFVRRVVAKWLIAVKTAVAELIECRKPFISKWNVRTRVFLYFFFFCSSFISHRLLHFNEASDSQLWTELKRREASNRDREKKWKFSDQKNFLWAIRLFSSIVVRTRKVCFFFSPGNVFSRREKSFVFKCRHSIECEYKNSSSSIFFRRATAIVGKVTQNLRKYVTARCPTQVHFLHLPPIPEPPIAVQLCLNNNFQLLAYKSLQSQNYLAMRSSNLWAKPSTTKKKYMRRVDFQKVSTLKQLRIIYGNGREGLVEICC